MTPARYRLLTVRQVETWELRCACGAVSLDGESYEEVKGRLVVKHALLMPLCPHRHTRLTVVS